MSIRAVVACVLGGLVLMAGAVWAVARTGLFSDVPPDHMYAEDIRWAVEFGVMEGRGDGTYRPDAPITRGQFARALRKYHLAASRPTAPTAPTATRPPATAPPATTRPPSTTPPITQPPAPAPTATMPPVAPAEEEEEVRGAVVEMRFTRNPHSGTTVILTRLITEPTGYDEYWVQVLVWRYNADAGEWQERGFGKIFSRSGGASGATTRSWHGPARCGVFTSPQDASRWRGDVGECEVRQVGDVHTLENAPLNRPWE